MAQKNTDPSRYQLYDLLMNSYFRKWALGDGSDKQAEQYWEKFMQDHPEKKELITEARLMVRQLRQRQSHTADRQQIVWDRIKEEIGEEAVPAEKSSKFTYSTYFKYAAILIAVLSAGLILWQYNQPATILLSTGNGQSRSLLLPDSSEVQLGANSEISYNKKFNSVALREVWVKGEANFRVKHLNKDPQNIAGKERFVVHLANSVDVEVLGTVFSVTDRRGKYVVNLESGSVKISTPQKKLLLKPGESAVYAADRHVLLKSRSVNTIKRQWQNNVLLMEKSTVADVIGILEDNYGIKIKTATGNILNKQLDGALPLNDEQRALLILSSITQTRISREADTVTLSAN